MHKTVSVEGLGRRFRDVLDEVTRDRVAYVFARGGRPEAALVPYDDFMRLQQLREQESLDAFDRTTARLAERNAAYSDEEVEADVKAAIAEVRAEPAR